MTYFSLITEDEKLSLKRRFIEEGINENISDEKKLPYVWSWLLDAETNCRSLRKQIEKLHKEQEKDMKEVENYVEHVWKLSNEKLKRLEKENLRIKKLLINSGKRNSNHDLDTPTRNDSMAPYNNSIQNGNLCDSLKIKTSDPSTVTKYKLAERNIVGKVIDEEEGIGEGKIKEGNVNNKVDELKNRLSGVEMEKQALEDENEALAFKLNNALTLCDKLEMELLDLKNNPNERKGKNYQNQLDGEEEEDIRKDRNFGNSNSGVSGTNESSLINKVKVLEEECDRLLEEVRSKEEKTQLLISKYNKRKADHRDRMLRLKNHIERETSRWEHLFQMANQRRILAEERLIKQKELSAILENKLTRQ